MASPGAMPLRVRAVQPISCLEYEVVFRDAIDSLSVYFRPNANSEGSTQKSVMLNVLGSLHRSLVAEEFT